MVGLPGVLGLCLRGDDGAGIGIRQNVGDLAIAIEDVDRHEDGAQAGDGQEQVNVFEAVGEIDAQALAGRKSPGGEGAGHAAGAVVKGAEGVSGAVPFQAGFVPAGD